MRVGSRHPGWGMLGVLALVAGITFLSGCSPDTPTLGATAPTAIETISPSGLAGIPSAAPSGVSSSGSSAPTSRVSGARQTRLPGDPNPLFTPGATNPAVTQATIGKTICVSGWTATIRPPSSYTTNLKQQQIVIYGYRDHALADYEEDHLISLEIGGAPRDPKNLWPEPYTVKLSDGRSVGARVKDLIENRLHALVCGGQITLVAAQREIASDWISAWFALEGQAPPPAGGGAASTPRPTPRPTTAPTSGAIKVTIASLSSPVARGVSATLVAHTKGGAACTIDVEYKSGRSTAQGLGPKTASGSGVVSWTWKVGSRTTLGSWPVTVTCTSGGKSAAARTTLAVH